MQSFLPYPDFVRSAACLDNKRLGKQRVEAWQILQAITNPGYGWQYHPAVQMWRGHPYSLACYGWHVCDTWVQRGFADTLQERFLECSMTGPVDAMPVWLGCPKFHASHRAALLAKDPAHYGQFGWSETPAINYWWPTKELTP